MFFSKEIKLLTITDTALIVDEIVNNTLINNKEISIDESIFFNGKINDFAFYKYSIEKLLNAGKNDYLIIRYSGKDLLFRNLSLPGLTKSEIDSYIEFNIKDFFPFDVDSYTFKNEQYKDNVFLYGVKSEFISSIMTIINELNFKYVIFTMFPSELLHNLSHFKLNQDSIVFNTSSSNLEYISIFNSTPVSYDQFQLYEFNVKNNNSPEMKDRLNRIISTNFKNYETYNIGIVRSDGEGMLYEAAKSIVDNNVKICDINYATYFGSNLSPIDFFVEKTTERSNPNILKNSFVKVALLMLVFAFIVFDYVYLSTKKQLLLSELGSSSNISDGIQETESIVTKLNQKYLDLEKVSDSITYIERLNVTNQVASKILTNYKELFNDNTVLNIFEYDNNTISLEVHSTNRSSVENLITQINAISDNSKFYIASVDRLDKYSTYRIVDMMEEDKWLNFL